MIQKIDCSVSVSFVFDHIKRRVYPKWLLWGGRLHAVDKIGFHHTYREGRVLHHVFSVTSKTLFFKLSLNTETLHWHLQEISDGLPD